MSRITETIEVEVPVRVAYDQWTQFEEFPKFMEGVERVIQLDDKTLDWTATVAGKVKHWRAEITEQEPDRVIAWRSIDGARNDGAVRFAGNADTTQVTLELDVDPDGFVETAGDALGFVARRAKGDMERFKEFIESRGHQTGDWRGEIQDGRVVRDDHAATGGSIGSTTGSAGSIGSTGSSAGSTSETTNPVGGSRSSTDR